MSCSVTSPPRSTSSSMAPSKSLTGPKSSSMRRLKGEISHKLGYGFVTSPKNIYPLGQTLVVITIGNVPSWTWIESFALCLPGNILSMLSSPAGYTPIVQLFLRASHVPWSFVSLLHGGHYTPKPFNWTSSYFLSPISSVLIKDMSGRTFSTLSTSNQTKPILHHLKCLLPHLA